MTRTTISYARCPPEDYLEALGVLYRRISMSWRTSVVADVYAEVQSGEIDLSGLWVARKKGRIVGVLLTQVLARHAAAIWPPEVELSWNRSAVAAGLIQAALNDLQSRGVRMAQALLDVESSPASSSNDLTLGGIPCVTTLTYLERATGQPLPILPGLPRFDWRSYSPATDAEFRRVLDASYVASLDMPELDGLRSLDQIIEGQRATGRFEPSRWLVGNLPEEPNAAAVVLMAETPDGSAWEIAYLGLSMQARGRGLGRVVLADALQIASASVERIELAVDERNVPADRLYRSAGFLPFDRRKVHLAILG